MITLIRPPGDYLVVILATRFCGANVKFGDDVLRIAQHAVVWGYDDVMNVLTVNMNARITRRIGLLDSSKDFRAGIPGHMHATSVLARESLDLVPLGYAGRVGHMGKGVMAVWSCRRITQAY